MSKVEQAVDGFESGYNCSQAVVGAYCEQFELEQDKALKIAAGFGGGIGRSGGICGALTGAIMVLGLKYGSSDTEDKQGKAKTYEIVSDAIKRFEERNGSVICRDLLGCDIATPQGRKTASEKDLFDTLCKKLVRDAAEILEKLIGETE
ncbi:MAG: C-GCAxxG-C-C family protein [Planctomycetota bacterium]|jgi:C_GCAxxG_C_C family probable redox protein